MKWALHHANLQVYDIEESIAFYRDILGLEVGAPHTIGSSFADLGVNETNLAVIGDGNKGLHLLKPLPDFSERTGTPINSAIGGHTAIEVEDLARVKRNLESRGIFHADRGDWAMPGVYQVYVYDPSGNLIELNQTKP